jgi:hypothetical protein
MDSTFGDDGLFHEAAPPESFPGSEGFGFDQPLFGFANVPSGVYDDSFDAFAIDGMVPQFEALSPALSGDQCDAPSPHGPAASDEFGGGLNFSFVPARSVEPVSQPTLPASVHDASFARALLSNCRTTDIVLPWETSFYKELFSDEPFSQNLVPEMPIGAFCNFVGESEPQAVAQTVADVARFPDDFPIFSACVGSTDDGPFNAVQSKLHNAAVQKFLIILRYDLESSATGKHILALGDDTQQMQGAHKIVEAVLGTRAPSTLVKRANSLLSFLRWFDRIGLTDVAPFSETCIWRYLQQLKDEDAPCTKGSSALSAFRFAHHILGFEELGPALVSRRLVGICELMLSKKRLLKQARVLTVAQVKGLHKSLRDVNLHVMDRAVVAYILFAIYGRCRNSDLLMIHSVEPDFTGAGGFVTIQTCNHKTGRLAMLKTRLMPIVVPARGVDGLVWVGDALKAFADAGVVHQTPIDGPLLPAPLGEPGLFMQRGLRASEVSSMVRKFVGSPEPTVNPASESVSSHSLKATTLAWCARFGLSPSVRSLLGRHASSLNETYAIYSRDLVCSPVAELQKVVDAIADGSFSPDSQRSEFFRAEHDSGEFEEVRTGEMPAAAETLVPSQTELESNVSELLECSGGGVEATEPGVDDHALQAGNGVPEHASEPEQADASNSSSSSSDSDDALSSAESDQPEPAARVKRFRAKIPENQLWFVHSKSHLVHRHDGNVQDGTMFTVCGRRLTGVYKPCTEATAWNVLCKSCNRK